MASAGLPTLSAWSQESASGGEALENLPLLEPTDIFALDPQPSDRQANRRLRTLADRPEPGDRWLLIVCGLPGDEEHRQKLTQATRQLCSDASRTLGVDDDRRIALVGDQQMASELSDVAGDCRVTTRQSLEETMQLLSERIDDQDSCWIVLLGHANLYRRSSRFNIAGPDVDQEQFAQWAAAIRCRQKVIMLTMPLSGIWMRPLAGKQTVVITATGAGLEMTGTEMPYALADVLSGVSEDQRLEDVDQDGQLSLLDLYLAVNIEIAARFARLDRLPTEHALLDDDGDGRGRELQADYLPADPLDPSKRGRRSFTLASIREGSLAQEILINLPEALLPINEVRQSQTSTIE